MSDAVLPEPKFKIGDRVRVRPGFKYASGRDGVEFIVSGRSWRGDAYRYFGDPYRLGCLEWALDLVEARPDELIAEMQARLGVLEAQRQNMLRLLDAWEDRMQRIHDSRLTRSAPQAIEECRREVSRVIECGPPIPPAPVDEAALAARRTLWICE